MPKFDRINWKKSLVLGGVALGIILGATSLPRYLMASDHDDGEADTKARSLNLTDLYAFGF